MGRFFGGAYNDLLSVVSHGHEVHPLFTNEAVVFIPMIQSGEVVKVEHLINRTPAIIMRSQDCRRTPSHSCHGDDALVYQYRQACDCVRSGFADLWMRELCMLSESFRGRYSSAVVQAERYLLKISELGVLDLSANDSFLSQLYERQFMLRELEKLSADRARSSTMESAVFQAGVDSLEAQMDASIWKQITRWRNSATRLSDRPYNVLLMEARQYQDSLSTVNQ